MRKFMLAFCALVLLGLSADVYGQAEGFRMFIHASDFNNLLIEGTPNTHGTAAGTAVPTEISSFGITGYAMTAADLVSQYFMWPDLYHNKLYPVACRVVWTSDSADDDAGVDWLVGMEEKPFRSETALEASTAAGLADQITFAADSTKVQFGVQVTQWDTFGVVAMSTYDGDCLVQLGVELDDDGDQTGDEPHFLGLELFFVPPDFRGANFYVPGITWHDTEHGIALPKRGGY